MGCESVGLVHFFPEDHDMTSRDIGRRMRDAEILLRMMAGSAQRDEQLREEARNYFRRYGEDPLPVPDEIATLSTRHEALRQAAKKVIDRWISPIWKDTLYTTRYINELRKAIEK